MERFQASELNKRVKAEFARKRKEVRDRQKAEAAAEVTMSDTEDTPATNSGNGVNNNGINNNNTPPVDYDRENSTDAAGILGKLVNIAKIEFHGKDLVRWLNRLETRMETYRIGAQWTKRLCLETALPPHLASDLGALFDKWKAAA